MFVILPRKNTQRLLATHIEATETASHSHHTLDLTSFPSVPQDRDERLWYFSPEQFTSERFLTWCRLYHTDHFPAPFGQHHRMIAEILNLRGQTVEFLAPREYGKSTFLYAFSDWCRCYGIPYVLHVEHDGNIAKRVSLGASQIVQNQRIKHDYGLRPGMVWKPNGGELVVLNDNPYAMTGESYLRAIGAREIARGSTSTQAERITIAIVNDVVANYQEAVSYAWNNFLDHFIREDLAYAGGGKRDEDITIFFVTTIQSTNDISDRLRSNTAITTYECPAVDGKREEIETFVEFVSNDIPNIRAAMDATQGTVRDGFTGQNFGREAFAEYCLNNPAYQAWFEKLRSTWPEQFPMSRHVSDIFRTSSQAWLQEKMHITGDSKFQRFQPEWFISYKPEQIPTHSRMIYAMCIDWSGLPKEGNDPKAIFCGAYDQDSTNLYTLGVWCDLATHEETFEKVYEMFWMCFPWYQIGTSRVFVDMEDIVSAGGIGQEYFEKLRLLRIAQGGSGSYYIPLPISPFQAGQRGNKLAAITALRPIAEQRRIHYIPGHTHQTLMVKQFTNFIGEHTHKPLPLDQKIDIPDTVAMFAHLYIHQAQRNYEIEV